MPTRRAALNSGSRRCGARMAALRPPPAGRISLRETPDEALQLFPQFRVLPRADRPESEAAAVRHGPGPHAARRR
ncbi:hypothetical protein BLAT2472_60206 [Burkholderia latens]